MLHITDLLCIVILTMDSTVKDHLVEVLIATILLTTIGITGILMVIHLNLHTLPTHTMGTHKEATTTTTLPIMNTVVPVIRTMRTTVIIQIMYHQTRRIHPG